MTKENKNEQVKPEKDKSVPAGGPQAKGPEIPAVKTEQRGGSERSSRRGGRRPAPRKETRSEGEEYLEKVLQIKRVTKVTKGNKRLAFSALVVVGDGRGHVGFGLDKAGEVAAAIKKALIQAKKSMVMIPLKGKTIPHEIIGMHGAARVLLKPASEGTGVIASGAVRAVCDGVGIRDILTKCHRSNNQINVVKATFDGLTRLKFIQKQEPGTPDANQ